MFLCICAYFQTTRIKTLKRLFSHLEWFKTSFDAFLGHQNQVLNKLFFSPLEWLKTCFDAFPDHQIQVLLLPPEELGPGMQCLLKVPFLKGWMTSPFLGLSTTLQAPLAGTFSWIRNLPIILSRSCVRFNIINQTLGYVILSY